LIDIPQDHAKATFTSKIEKQDALIDVHTDKLGDVYAKYRAYALRPKIYFIWNKKRVVIEDMKLDQLLYKKNKDRAILIKE
jgi:methionyl-tRNA formyltransferase